MSEGISHKPKPLEMQPIEERAAQVDPPQEIWVMVSSINGAALLVEEGDEPPFQVPPHQGEWIRYQVKQKHQKDQEAEPQTVCQFCSWIFPAHLGAYGCPNCHGEGLEDEGETRWKPS